MFHKIHKIETLAAGALAFDRYAALRRIDDLKSRLRGSSRADLEKSLAALQRRLVSSAREKTWRRENRPRPAYPQDLPIIARKDDIVAAIQGHPVVIISGETGSGKTTQIPKFCLEAGRGIDGKIGCTQPRRIAATTVASRIAEELGEIPGRSVGYKIRFKSKTGPRTFIKMMTDGILLSETQRDPLLSRYDTIIVDEAHERNLNIDFVLGILKTLLKKRDDLKVVITSATIDTEKFSKAFANAPVIEVSGRMYPVEVRYVPADDEKGETEEPSYVDMAARAVDELQKQGPRGDVLVFMPTEQGIREVCDMIRGRRYPGVTVFPLFARLTANEQKSVFANITGRKIIVATNIAETSITIPGIKYVVDTGLARILQYSPRSRTTALPVLPISKSSADQRMGRCGRVQNGVCIRLFSEEDYLARPQYTPPEILRSNLAEVILRMIALRLGDVSEFPFVDRPSPKSVQDGFDLLEELGAIRKHPSAGSAGRKAVYELSPVGKQMADMPIDPRLSRMLIEARKEGCLDKITIIAAALSIRDPRERPAEKSIEADQAHALFKDPASDFVSYLNIWQRFHETLKKEKTNASLRRFCRDHFLSFNRMREWRDIHRQIGDILSEQAAAEKTKKFTAPSPAAFRKVIPPEKNNKTSLYGSAYTAVHKSILSGFLANIAVKKDKNIYRAARGREAMVFPGSGLFDRAGAWVVAAEVVETSRLFVRTVANIDCAWLESLGATLCRQVYLNPRWEMDSGAVVASEQVSLYGLIIVSERTVVYGRIHPAEACDIFIQGALVEGRVKRPFPFMIHNQRLIDDIKEMENRIRRRDLLVGEEELFAFYKQRLPLISDVRTLQTLLKKKKSDRFLRMKTEDLLLNTPDRREMALYPDALNIEGNRFDFSYEFDPGQPEDGVTLNISAGQTARVSADHVDWLVPGLFREKLSALIRGLPKKYRTRLVPINQTVEMIASEMPKSRQNLATALSQFISDRLGCHIPASAWALEQLPDHLKMRIALTDSNGKVIRAGRDKTILNRPAKTAFQSGLLKKAREKWERDGIVRWDFGDLPDSVSFYGNGGGRATFFVGLKRVPGQKTGVSLRIFVDGGEAKRVHKAGVCALLQIYFSSELKYLKKIWQLPAAGWAGAAYFGGRACVETRLYESIEKDYFCRNIRTQKAFEAYAQTLISVVRTGGMQKLEAAAAVLEAYHEARQRLYRLEQAAPVAGGVNDFMAGLRADLDCLVPDSFVALYAHERLIHVARYVRAISIRARRGVADFEKDRKHSLQLAPYQASLKKLLAELTPLTSEDKRQAVESFFWLLEEYKVSIFAQELKTAVPVSPQRLEKKLLEIERMV